MAPGDCYSYPECNMRTPAPSIASSSAICMMIGEYTRVLSGISSSGTWSFHPGFDKSSKEDLMHALQYLFPCLKWFLNIMFLNIMFRIFRHTTYLHHHYMLPGQAGSSSLSPQCKNNRNLHMRRSLQSRPYLFEACIDLEAWFCESFGSRASVQSWYLQIHFHNPPSSDRNQCIHSHGAETPVYVM